MDFVQITGGRKLQGKVSIQGSKNATLPMIAAALLHRGVSVLKGCPKLADVYYMEEILRALGAQTWWEGENLYLDCSYADKTEIPEELSKKMRSSIILMGAILARNKKVTVGYPGGCVIGARPIDLHLQVLRGFGVEIMETSSLLVGKCDKMRGSEIVFEKKSVGATEQGILAAVLAEGKTVLRNCSLEPEILHLCHFLETMGAEISGAGSACICITGKEELRGGEMKVPPDRIVAGTYFCAAAITRGRIEMEHVPLEEMGAFLEVYRKIGGQYQGKSGKLVADGSRVQYPAEFQTDTYPGFPTDLQSPMTAVLATIPGESHVKETIFEDRYKAVTQLRRMGAHIEIEGAYARIYGGRPLKGSELYAQELRGGAALVLAGLAAEGVTTLWGYHYIQRGYACMIEELRALGGLVTRNIGIKIYENIQLSQTDSGKY